MKKYKIIIIILIILLPIVFLIGYLFYGTQTLNFKVKNSLNSDIDVLAISLVEGQQKQKVSTNYLYNIPSNTEVNLQWDVNDLTKRDGTYLYEVIQNDKIIFSKQEGYYTNGNHLDKNHFIEITKDNIAESAEQPVVPEIPSEVVEQPKTNTSLEKLNTLVSTLEVEDPENYSYLGCGIIHGKDGNINNWINYEDNYLEKLYAFLDTANAKYEVIKLDYSQNPHGASDDVQIVTCSCEDYEEAKELIESASLDFTDLLWHTEDKENDPMTSCLNTI